MKQFSIKRLVFHLYMYYVKRYVQWGFMFHAIIPNLIPYFFADLLYVPKASYVFTHVV